MKDTYDYRSFILSFVCVLLFSFHSFSLSQPQFSWLDEESLVSRQGGAQPVRVELSADLTSITADEVIMFTAQLYDNLNNQVSGEVVWSCSNGSITDDGIFYPWSSGSVLIQASHNGLVGSMNITVTPGVGQSLRTTSLTAHALLPVTLTADLLDARGNARTASNVVWTIDGTYIGTGEPVWTPMDTGEYSIRARLYQMEHDDTLVVSAGAPHEFVFDQGMQVRSGSALQMTPRLLDVNGFEMNITTAGNRVWEVENGSILPSGWFTATQPGLWAVNVSAGNITGAGMIRVVPADATISQVTVLSDSEQFTAGVAYEIAAMRTDSLGYTGTISPPLANFTVSSGGLSNINGAVYWTPGAVGTHELRVDDDGVLSTLTVDVVHGPAIDAELILVSSNFAAGGQSTVAFMATDVVGNEWMVNGTMTLVNGNSSQFSVFTGYVVVTPEESLTWRIEGNWYDVSTGTRYEPVFQLKSTPGQLAFIQLNGEGTILPSDTPLALNPLFFDAYSNPLEDIGLNWTVDGVDSTIDILLSDLHWIPTTVGGHEIRANADGVFATVRLTVVAGDARNLVTNYEDGLTVQAGVATELFIQTIDAHGNLAPSTAVMTSLDGEFGTLTASSSGDGYWDFAGRTKGTYSLELMQDNATHVLDITVESGAPVRIISTMDAENIAQGDTVLLRVQSVDVYGNSVEVIPANTTISCTSGSAKHVTSDTWELDISTSGNDRSCNVLWNGLLSQNYFDVESVLLGGAVGSTNTAMGLGIFLLALILVTLVVLVRKANQEEVEWTEDGFEDEVFEDHSSMEGDTDDDFLDNSDSVTIDGDETTLSPPHLQDDVRATLAKKAAEVGVMQAISGTEQGSSGWYVDVSTEMQYWDVGSDGTWTRVE
ncbi:hypothetical protein N9O16_00175 [Candidatus Poseidoniaceae archaeon]|nr:hypothetical protein [Candidatus Poseidoniaceae archaeon]